MTILCYSSQENLLNGKDFLITLQKRFKVIYGLYNKSLKDIFLGTFFMTLKLSKTLFFKF